jgi:hypothetical protein
MYKRIVLFLLLAILLALPAQQIKAESEIIQVDGLCVIVGEWQGDDFRFWSKEDWSMLHWRNNTFLFWCDASDERLTGYYVFKDSWNMFSNENNPYQSQTFSTGYSADEEGNPTGLWVTSGTGHWDWDWNFAAWNVFKGRGEYQGLHANLLLTNDADGNYPITGKLYVSGN